MGLKYKIEYFGVTDDEYKIEIHIPNYSGEPIDLRGVGRQTLLIERNGNEDPYEKHILSSQAIIKVYDEGNIDLDELMLAPDLTYKVNIFKNGLIYWVGFLVSDGIQETLNYRGELELVATDGMLGMEGLSLKVTNPVGVNFSNDISSAYRCPLNIVRQCFNTIGNVLPINWMLETRNSKMLDSDAFCGDVEFSRNGEIFFYKDKDTLWYFENILKSFNLHCLQHEGEWWIIDFQYLKIKEGVFEGWNIEGSMGEVTAFKKVVDFNKKDVMFINDVGVRMLKKPISKVKVTYDSFRDENIIPNGNMNFVLSSGTLYWTRSKNGYVLPDDSLNGRVDDKLGNVEKSILFVSSEEDEYITFMDAYMGDYICYDALKLFPRFTFGFSVMPQTYPVKGAGASNPLEIDWEKKPLQLEISYTFTNMGVEKVWFLNENGYWIPEGLSQMVITNSGSHKSPQYMWYEFENTPLIGQKIMFIADLKDGGYNYAEYTFQENHSTTREALNAIDAWIRSKNGNIFVGSPINITPEVKSDNLMWFYNNVKGRGFRVEMSDETGRISTRINMLAENAMNDDILRFQFTAKGGETRIKVPAPMDYGGANKGEMRIRFHHRFPSRASFDDVYMNVDENHDVYEAKLSNLKDNPLEYSLGISSSFSGFLLSNYMSGFSKSSDEMYYERFGIEATLTEHYARDVIRQKSKPYQVIDQDIYDDVSPINLINDEFFAVAKTSFNTETNTTQVTMVEYKLNNTFPTITHYGSNDERIS